VYLFAVESLSCLFYKGELQFLQSNALETKKAVIGITSEKNLAKLKVRMTVELKPILKLIETDCEVLNWNITVNEHKNVHVLHNDNIRFVALYKRLTTVWHVLPHYISCHYSDLLNTMRTASRLPAAQW
jgi:hypothetical protein